jgi:phosphomannomutase
MGRGPAAGGATGALSEHADLLDAFVDHVLSFVDVESFRPLRVVADTANGMGGLVVPAVFERLPMIELEVMYGELDGTFPNHPADPLQPANQRDLQARVSRAAPTSGSPSTATPTGCSWSTRPARGSRLHHHGDPARGAAVEPGRHRAAQPDLLEGGARGVREHGGTPVRTRVGHSYIKQVMAETGAAFGGEHSAHYYFRDNYRADSGLIASLLVLEQLSAVRRPLSVCASRSSATPRAARSTPRSTTRTP